MSRGTAALLVALALVGLAAGGARPGALAASPSDEAESGRLVVRLDAGAATAEGLAALVGGRVAGEIAALDAVVIDVPAAAGGVARAASRLAGREDVRSVERDGTAEISTVPPDDPLWVQQWGLAQIAAPQAWRITTGSDDVTIAVLDTGVDTVHPDLDGAVEAGANFTMEGGPGDTRDDNGHGTMVAGIAAARANNATGIAGTCWTCRLLPVKVMRADGNGSLVRIAAGMVWAVDQGADVLNLSLGSFDDLEVVRDAVAYATSRGVPVIASAGNFGDAAGEHPSRAPVYPAAYDDVIAVAANSEDGTRYHRSSFGDWVEVTAAACNPGTSLGSGYQSLCGTSASAPLVAGTVALGIAEEPDATRGQRHEALTATAAAADFVEFGRVDAAAMLERLADIAEPQPGPEPSPAPDPGGGDDGEAETGPGPSLRRVAGADRFATAARLSAQTFSPGIDRVYVATGQAFPDALAAGAAAGADDAPVLLTAHDALPGATRDELNRLRPDEVVVVGGVDAVSSATAEAAGAAAAAPVRRISGADRFATAAAVAREGDDAPDGTVFVATGTDFPDALAGVPAAVSRDAPVLLATRDELPAATRDALARLSPQRVEIVGGPGAVGPGVEARLGGLAGSVRRHGGGTRFGTAVRVSQAFFDPGVLAAHVATGAGFADALAGGPVAGRVGGPLLLVARDQLPDVTAGELRRLRPHANVVLGGRSVISEQVEAAAGQASGAGD